MQEEKPNFGKQLNPFQRFLFTLGGLASFGLGFVGVFVPLLPTVPFLLLSAYCFARSSERYYQWLINHRYFGEHILNYRDHHATTAQVKRGTIALLWISIGITAIFAVSLWWIRLILLIIAVSVTIHVASLNTVAEKKQGPP